MNDLIIIGSGGFAREVAWLVERINEVIPTWRLVGFCDNNVGLTIGNYKIVCDDNDAMRMKECFFVCAVGSSKLRKRITTKFVSEGLKFATLVDPSVQKSDSVVLGEGSIVCANTILTVDVRVGRHCIINLGCTIGHDSILNDFVTVYPSVNISGNTRYGECVELGTGTQIIQGKSVGAGTIVGAGSVVVKDLPEECTAVGAPCKPIKFHGEQ